MTKIKQKREPIKVIELFAGVGGFRVGLERASKRFKTVWFNQWEPAESEKAQYAWRVYCNSFGENPEECARVGTNTDIHHVDTSKIPEYDLLVGGFPCQDYSVARPLRQSAGLSGKKGVLWWQIHRLLESKKKKPSYLILENVDRLLKSPSAQRGRDFAIMLSTLSDLGYAVEWRVINAAEYGMPQRRRRVYILGYRKGTPLYEEVRNAMKKAQAHDWISKNGVMASTFPIDLIEKETSMVLEGEPHEITATFKYALSPFHNSGIMHDRVIYTAKIKPKVEAPITLGQLVHAPGEVADDYLKKFEIAKKDIALWKRLKGAKSEPRTSKSGHTYQYTEGSMSFPDPLSRPSRTIITAEGGASATRFKHVIEDYRGKLRRLTPIELERLSMFPENHTHMDGITDIKRAFFVGNALVVGIVERLGRTLEKRGFPNND